MASFFGVAVPPLPANSTSHQHIPPNKHYVANTYIRDRVQQQLQDILDTRYKQYDLQVQKPSEAVQKNMQKKGVTIDFTIAGFSLLKTEGTPAIQELAQILEKAAVHIHSIHVAGPYLNIELDIQTFGSCVVEQIETLADTYGYTNIGNDKVVVIDFSSPNIAKYMTVAHLRSTVIGQSLYHIYSALGYRVIRDNHLGDWGTQFGVLGRAVELWGDDIAQLQSKNSHEVVQGLFTLYVKMHEEIDREESTTQNAKDLLKDQGRQWFAKLEQGDQQARALWKWALETSLLEFRNMYARLGVDFEYWLGESFYVPFGNAMVDKMIELGYAESDHEGRIVVKFDDSLSLFPLTLRKSDGTGIYASRDICCLAARTSWFVPEKILYVVGEEQSVYFTQLFLAFKNFSVEHMPELCHIRFGLLSLPEGKMSTRRGNVIFLEDVINEAVARAKKKILANYGEDIPQNFDIEKTAEAIGIGAVIYSDLGGARKRNITFDWNSALAFHGNSGPYMQYAYARICSMEKKIHDENIEVIPQADMHNLSIYEKEILRLLSEFPSIIMQAARQNEPSVIAMYVYRVASSFNSMYRNLSFLHENNIVLRSSRVRIARATRQVIHNGMKLLNMPLVDQM